MHRAHTICVTLVKGNKPYIETYVYVKYQRSLWVKKYFSIKIYTGDVDDTVYTYYIIWYDLTKTYRIV